jgi:hypothetical protein
VHATHQRQAGRTPTRPPAGLTPPCQTDPFTTTPLLAALEAAWQTVRDRHTDVPEVVLIVGTGSPARASARLTYGHFATSTWQHGNRRLPEVMVSGEGLSRTPNQVMSTLLHEAAHGIATTRGIKDTSRQGRWHNKRFAALAGELGLDIAYDRQIGWSPSTLRPDTATAYAAVIGTLGDAMRAYRRIDTPTAPNRATTANTVTAECDCGRKLRIPAVLYTAGPILCGLCQHPFTDPDSDVEDGR